MTRMAFKKQERRPPRVAALAGCHVFHASPDFCFPKAASFFDEITMANSLRLALLIALAVSIMQQAACGQINNVVLTEPGKLFKEYEAEAPPIKRIVYEQSYAIGKYGPGVELVDGAIQTGGYFIRHLTNSPYTKQLLVSGASSESEWEYFPENENVSYGPPTCWTNYASSMNYPPLVALQTVARLGLPRPFPGHDGFSWTSQVDFVFFDPFNQYVGHIVRFDNQGRTIEVEFHSENKSDDKATTGRVSYGYDSNQTFPPSSFVVDIKGPDFHVVTTNLLHALEIGQDDKHAGNGYYLKEFLPDDATIGTIYVISNHIRYTLQQDRSLVAYKYSDAVERSLRPVRRTILFVFLAVSILTAVYLVWLRGRSN